MHDANRTSADGSARPPALSASSQAALLLAGVLGGLVAAELALRLSGGALPHLGIFVERADTIALLPLAESRVRRGDGVSYAMHTDARGWRVPAGVTRPPPCAWVVVGDSQVMGSGVEAEAAFPALLGACNLGVPGYGLLDALASVPPPTEQGPELKGVVVVANEANDWEEGTARVTRRYAVRGGWLIRRENADTFGAALWGSPLSRVHLLHLLGSVVLSSLFAPDEAPAPAWTDPDAALPTSRALASAIQAFADVHPTLKVVVAWLPVDVVAVDRPDARSPFAAAAAAAPKPTLGDTRLRDAFCAALAQPSEGAPPTAEHGPTEAPTVPSPGVELARAELQCVDLLGPLAHQPDAFLSYDYHLSEAGHARIANALSTELSP